MRGDRIALLAAVCALLQGCSRKDDAAPPAAPPTTTVPSKMDPPTGPLRFVDGDGRPIREARLALLAREAFDDKGRLREEAVATSPERIRVIVEDSAADAPASVTVSTLTLPLEGPPGRRQTRPFLLIGDREDAAAASGSAVAASPGGRVEVRYRNATAGSISVGPAAIHQIPVRFIAAGPGLPPTADLEKAVQLRLAQANAVWEPLGRRFTRGAVVRLDYFPGLFLIRGRAAGLDGQGRPSKVGVLIDGNELSVPGVWKDDGAPMTPKATAQRLMVKSRRMSAFSVLDGAVAGDRDAVVVRVRRGDGTPATIERLPEGNDVSQALTPLPTQLVDGIEVSPSARSLSLEEIALLGSGKGAAAEGLDVYLATGLHSLQVRPSFKIYPEGLPPWSTAGSAIVSWKLLDDSGRYPYGLARILGDLMLPEAPGAGDTLFAEPMSETAGVAAHKRVTAATAAKIAERGRALSGQK